MATKSRPEIKLVPTQYTLQDRGMAQMQFYPLKNLTENKQHTMCVWQGRKTKSSSSRSARHKFKASLNYQTVSKRKQTNKQITTKAKHGGAYL